ncbi:MAG TPA: type II toxin-antitoxin system RelE/ParE family toxin [Caulobacteraceae bacterium]|jgi:toxin ParE1/3/4|nr:type II toxin-antitoxin system RelE/ParE family toxin [Caulobacteraceae bacterium]
MKAVVTARARRDLFILLAISRTQFGLDAQRRYRLLLEQAIADIAADPHRAGVAWREEVSSEVWFYHSRHSRSRTPPGQRVGRPRHVLIFRVRQDQVEILRVLHDAMDFPSHTAGL